MNNGGRGNYAVNVYSNVFLPSNVALSSSRFGVYYVNSACYGGLKSQCYDRYDLSDQNVFCQLTCPRLLLTKNKK